ncbi:thaumatin family protein [Erwinia sp. MMLR14_017]|uniref:thaumatin family protein n=1 Tax=Erwinia sp. MMLR14_017 TaxID=3093842 RepID=UPI0029905266|nr:thaumatin family protein [Erwinia sp. MMLR14_017]MDW8845685.1 thaumatin family protein [Erwinia sp. MMLR14_017]
MNMQVGSGVNRVLQDLSDSGLNSLLKTQPESLSSQQTGSGHSISFGSPATSNLPELSGSKQADSSTDSSSFSQFLQTLGKLLQNAFSAIDTLAQQINKAHGGGSGNAASGSATSGQGAGLFAEHALAEQQPPLASVIPQATTPAATSSPATQMATPESTAPQSPTTVDSAAASTSASAVSSDADIDPSQNSLTFENKGDKAMTISFTPNADGSAKPDDLTLQPGETKTQKFDPNWSGNFRSTQGDGANATLGEVKFDGSSGQTFYDVSYIEGNNAAMTIGPAKGDGRVSGTLDDLVSNAPDSIKAKDAEGNVYGLKKSTTANQQDAAVVDYYRQHVAADKGYVIPSDNASTLGSSSKNLKVELKG